MQQTGSPEALFAAISGAGNEVTQGWMRLVSGEAMPWIEALQRNQALHAAYLEKQTRLWTSMLAGRPEPVVDGKSDRRFLAREWRENPYYDYLRQSYLLASSYLEELVEASELGPDAKDRARFAARQWLDALCPANFPATNPDAMRQAIATKGESLARGLANLLADAHKGRVSQTDESAFEVGRNLGVTPGAVVFENELIQLIQYRATTAEVAKRPLVMVPPCINKYYILDLQPENSFVGHAVASGHTVFMISWRNVGPELGHLTWDDYLEKGVFAALRVAKEISGAEQVNALGFCVGGTLLGAALAVGCIDRICHLLDPHRTVLAIAMHRALRLVDGYLLIVYAEPRAVSICVREDSRQQHLVRAHAHARHPPGGVGTGRHLRPRARGGARLDPHRGSVRSHRPRRAGVRRPKRSEYSLARPR